LTPIPERRRRWVIPAAAIAVLVAVTATDQEGRYTLRAVPPGTVTIRVLRVGYAETKKPAVVRAGQTVTLDFNMERAIVQLQEVVTTATGEQRRVELGNSVAQIDAADLVAKAPVTRIQDVINSRTPGVIVTGGSQTGGGARVRIRGTSSLSLSNDPIYIIDGVRMTSNSGSISLFTGGASPSRVGDLNPEEIENVEIVKGPSAATLYGTDAANGVVVITTKKGRAGAPRWTTYAEGGLLDDLHTYPTAYTIAGHSPNSTKYRECGLPLISAGSCIMDSVRTLNIFEEPDLTPIDLGYRHQFGAQVSGGSDVLRYFLSGERESETNVMQLPQFEQQRLDSTGVSIADYTMRPNALQKYSFRANMNAAITPKLDVGVSSGYTNLDQRFSLESNATAGLGSQVFGGPGYRTNGAVLGSPKNGYRAWTPGYTWQEQNGQLLNRFVSAVNANWRPLAWLQNRANIGMDYSSRVDDNLLLRGQGPPITANYRKGFKDNNRTQIKNFSADLGSTANWQPRTTLGFKTTLGAQYVAYKLDQGDAFASDLPPGTQTAGAGATQSASEGTTLQKTLGIFVDEQVAVRDRLFLGFALRTDQNSAFGTQFQRVVYPKASVSWILSDESFFPRMDWLDQFRFRAAYGASGVQPGPNDALKTFAGTVANIKGTDEPGVANSALGNAALRPERSTEFETGFDTRFWRNRVNLEFTYFNKVTKDALISATLPPSLGAATSVRRNLGSIRNAGFEGLVSAQLIDRRAVGLDLTINASSYSNELVDLGGTPPQIGTTTRAVEGYPIFGFWARPITGWEDRNGDGILTYNADPAKNEVFVGDEPIFRGYHQPRYTLTVTPGLDLFQHRLRLATLVDYRGGHLWYNNTERIRCVSRQNCNGLMNPNASFEEQAMVVATRDHPAKTLDGFFQPGWFWKLRELTATYTLGQTVAAKLFRGRDASLTFAARNLGFITNYRGVDPESDRTSGDSGDTPDEFQTLAPPSYFILRLNIHF
jgi:TonB-linked SusC/RagA family outer membrane protein